MVTEVYKGCVLLGAFLDTCVGAVKMVAEVFNGRRTVRRLGYMCMGGEDGDRGL